MGHSERRATASVSETDETVNRKVRASLAHDLVPIVCVGESLEQREAGQTHAVVGGQVATAFTGLTGEQVSRCVVGYEPIWAIGTGQAATPVDANRVAAAVDPQMVRYGHWVWHVEGAYFGIPAQNFVGRLATTLTIYLAYRALESRWPLPQ